mmetsp:Transcript_50928/g.150117  ORF Transcript_50928/g.150117 Transcript_50928/m.150117 type:complete len:389 (-) Transcript_50928:18-1184(-)
MLQQAVGLVAVSGELDGLLHEHAPLQQETVQRRQQGFSLPADACAHSPGVSGGSPPPPASLLAGLADGAGDAHHGARDAVERVPEGRGAHRRVPGPGNVIPECGTPAHERALCRHGERREAGARLHSSGGLRLGSVEQDFLADCDGHLLRGPVGRCGRGAARGVRLAAARRGAGHGGPSHRIDATLHDRREGVGRCNAALVHLSGLQHGAGPAGALHGVPDYGGRRLRAAWLAFPSHERGAGRRCQLHVELGDSKDRRLGASARRHRQGLRRDLCVRVALLRQDFARAARRLQCGRGVHQRVSGVQEERSGVRVQRSRHVHAGHGTPKSSPRQVGASLCEPEPPEPCTADVQTHPGRLGDRCHHPRGSGSDPPQRRGRVHGGAAQRGG